MENYKFNIGDIITIIHGGYESNDPFTFNGISSFSQTSNRTIEEIQFINGKNWYKVSNHGNWVTEEGLKLITPIKEQLLTINDLVKYEYYHVKGKKNDNYWAVFRFKTDFEGQNKAVYTCLLNSIEDYKKDDWVNLDHRITRKATAEEIQWLEICSKENKFIEFDKIKDYMKTKDGFIVGDWVKIIANGSGVGVKDNGLIAQLVDKTTVDHRFDYYQSPFAVKCRDGKYNAMDTKMYIKALSHEIPNNSVNTFPKEQPKAYDYEVVHCKTQEEWDFVCSKIKNPPSKECFENCDTDNSKGNCIDYNRHSSFCWKDYYVKRGDTLIYSFEEWCFKFNHKMPNNTPELSLLEQAKLKYPIGTRFICPYFKSDCLKGKGNLVDHHNLTISESGDITGSGMYYLRYKNQWAEIVQESPKLPIVGKVYDSSFQYVECICSYTGKEVGKIYEVYDSPDWFKTKQTIKKFMSFGNWTAWFKPSTYSEYLKQQNSITPEECINNDVIEVGDEVELIKTPHAGYYIGDRCIIQKVKNSNDFEVYKKGTTEIVGGCNFKGHWKITRKANTQTTTINKKVDEQLPKNIVQDTENWINTKPNKPKPQIFSDNYGKGSFNEKLILTKTIKKQKSNLVL